MLNSAHGSWRNLRRRPEESFGQSNFIYTDWEGDTIEGKKSSVYIATVVERKSRYLLARKLENKMAATLTAQGTKSFRSVPRKMRRTLTVDNGSEFADFKKFKEKPAWIFTLLSLTTPGKEAPMKTPTGYCDSIFPKELTLKKVTEEDVNPPGQPNRIRGQIASSGGIIISVPIIMQAGLFVKILARKSKFSKSKKGGYEKISTAMSSEK